MILDPSDPPRAPRPPPPAPRRAAKSRGGAGSRLKSGLRSSFLQLPARNAPSLRAPGPLSARHLRGPAGSREAVGARVFPRFWRRALGTSPSPTLLTDPLGRKGLGGSFSARPLNPGPDGSRGKVAQPPRGAVGRSSGDGGKEKRAPGCGSARPNTVRSRRLPGLGVLVGLVAKTNQFWSLNIMYVHVYMQHIRKAVVQVHRRTRLLFA